jgi:hypothetical protein
MSEIDLGSHCSSSLPAPNYEAMCYARRNELFSYGSSYDVHMTVNATATMSLKWNDRRHWLGSSSLTSGNLTNLGAAEARVLPFNPAHLSMNPMQ